MTHIEFKKVTEFLDIKQLYVIMNQEEYLKFKKIDLFSEQQEVFNKIGEDFEENYPEDNFEELNFTIAFWLDINDDFNILSYHLLRTEYDFMDTDEDGLIENITYNDISLFEVKNQIVLNYDKFIDLIS